MREYTIQLYDERTEKSKGTIKIKAKNRDEMEWKVLQWQEKHPGYLVDCIGATSRLIEAEDVGEVTID